MKRTRGQWILSIALLGLAVVMLITGVVGYSQRSSGYVADTLSGMRIFAVLRTAADGVIDEIALKARIEARAWAQENITGRNPQRDYYNMKEAEARAEAEKQYAEFRGMDTSALSPRIEAVEAAQIAYAELEAVEKAAYAERAERIAAMVESLRGEMQEQMAALLLASGGSFAASAQAEIREGLAEHMAGYEALDEIEKKIYDLAFKALFNEIRTELTATEVAVSEDEIAAGEESIDYSAFVASETLSALGEDIHAQYLLMWQALSDVIPELTTEMGDDLEQAILAVVYENEQDFERAYDRYANANAESSFTGSDSLKMMVIRRGDDLLTIGVGLALFALAVFFYGELVRKLGMPRFVIMMFFVLLCVMAGLYGINVSGMIGNVLKRTGMYGVLALAMLPGIQCGISLNMGMTVGIVGGLLSTLIALEYDMTGWGAFFFSVVLGCVFAVPIGWAYSKLLNRLKGNEMTVSTYVGFSFVSLMSIAWMLLPFYNIKLTWALGTGLRVMHNMAGSFGSILNNLWAFNLFGIQVPTGLLLFFLLCCGALYLFSRSKTGTAMIAAGSSPRFAEAAGINVDLMRTIGTTLSTVVAAVGIIVYSQSFGFMQLYSGPRQMGFIAASAILIGGASVSRAKVSHVIIGTFLFQGVLAMGIQVANAAISEGGLSEVMRILISNGIILYALTQTGGEGRA